MPIVKMITPLNLMAQLRISIPFVVVVGKNVSHPSSVVLGMRPPVGVLVVAQSVLESIIRHGLLDLIKSEN